MNIVIQRGVLRETIEFPEDEQKPGIVDGFTLAPIAVILNELGFNVVWRKETAVFPKGYLRATKGNETIDIYNGESYFDVTTKYGDNEDLIRYSFPDYVSVKSMLIGGRLMVPIRNVLESVCCKVDWKPESVTISPPTDNDYTVKYNYCFGPDIPNAKPYFDATNKGGSVTLPRPSRVGYIFDGWYTDKTGGDRISYGEEEYTPSRSETLYARWIEKNNHRLSDAYNVDIDDCIFSSISQSEKLDFYRITFAGSGNVMFKLTIPQNAQYTLHLLNENIEVLATANGAVGAIRSITYNVQSGVPYILRIGAVDTENIVENENYLLQFVPEVAKALEITLSSQIIRDNEASIITLNNSEYTNVVFSTDSDYIEISQNIITAIKSCTAHISAVDTISNHSDSKAIRAAIRLNEKFRISQWNANWRNVIFGHRTDGSPVTIGYGGCGLCCITMGLLYEDFADDITDDLKRVALNAVIDAKFHNSNGNLIRSVQEREITFNSKNFRVSIIPVSDFTEIVDMGKLAIVRIHFYYYEKGEDKEASHFVLIDGIDPKYKDTTSGTDLLRKYLVADPNDGMSRSLYDAIKNKLTRSNRSGDTPNISHLDTDWTRKLIVTTN